MTHPPVSPLWGHPSVAQAYITLRERCGPALGMLAFNAQLPDRSHAIILEWADDLDWGDGATVLDLPVLERVLPALLVALIACHSYSASPGVETNAEGAREGGITLHVTDLGNGWLVAETLNAIAVIALALHGRAGDALIARTKADLDDKLAKLALMIVQAG